MPRVTEKQKGQFPTPQNDSKEIGTPKNWDIFEIGKNRAIFSPSFRNFALQMRNLRNDGYF